VWAVSANTRCSPYVQRRALSLDFCSKMSHINSMFAKDNASGC